MRALSVCCSSVKVNGEAELLVKYPVPLFLVYMYPSSARPRAAFPSNPIRIGTTQRHPTASHHNPSHPIPYSPLGRTGVTYSWWSTVSHHNPSIPSNIHLSVEPEYPILGRVPYHTTRQPVPSHIHLSVEPEQGLLRGVRISVEGHPLVLKRR